MRNSEEEKSMRNSENEEQFSKKRSIAKLRRNKKKTILKKKGDSALEKRREILWEIQKERNHTKTCHFCRMKNKCFLTFCVHLGK